MLVSAADSKCRLPVWRCLETSLPNLAWTLPVAPRFRCRKSRRLRTSLLNLTASSTIKHSAVHRFNAKRERRIKLDGLKDLKLFSRPETGSIALETADMRTSGTPHLIWFTERSLTAPASYARKRKMLGESRALEKAIWLHTSLKGTELLLTVAHEARHIWQWKHRILARLEAANSREDYRHAE